MNKVDFGEDVLVGFKYFHKHSVGAIVESVNKKRYLKTSEGLLILDGSFRHFAYPPESKALFTEIFPEKIVLSQV